MKFEVSTHMSPEKVLEQAEAYYAEHTGMTVAERAADRLELTGAIGSAVIKAYRDHGHTTVYAETNRGVGLDVTDQTLRFLHQIPHI
jgi:hypothetical protein